MLKQIWVAECDTCGRLEKVSTFEYHGKTIPSKPKDWRECCVAPNVGKLMCRECFDAGVKACSDAFWEEAKSFREELNGISHVEVVP